MTMLDLLLTRHVCSPAMPEVFTAQEAADYLRIHVDTLYAHARTGAIPARKLGEGPKAQWRFSKAALDAYLLNGGQ